MRFAALGLIFAAVHSAATAQEAELPSWLAGCWEMRDGERWAEECWTVPRAGMMMGSGRTGTANTMRSWEFMRVERAAEGLTFSASPGGAGWTSFAAVPDPGAGVTFVNAANDFPQRVRYWREGELLKAEISLGDGSQAMDWTFTRMGG